jgi:hypothetical protein
MCVEMSTSEHKPTLAQLVERRTVVFADKSLGRWFESGRSDVFRCVLLFPNFVFLLSPVERL